MRAAGQARLKILLFQRFKNQCRWRYLNAFGPTKTLFRKTWSLKTAWRKPLSVRECSVTTMLVAGRPQTARYLIQIKNTSTGWSCGRFLDATPSSELSSSPVLKAKTFTVPIGLRSESSATQDHPIGGYDFLLPTRCHNSKKCRQLASRNN
jgi:hypothetical protein